MPLARILLARGFDKFAKKQGISDQTLVEAVLEIEAGLVGADYGGNVIKQRVARAGSGKSGGYRTVVVFRHEDRAIFVEGFSKNVKPGHSPDEVAVLRVLAGELLRLTWDHLELAMERGTFRELEREEANDE